MKSRLAIIHAQYEQIMRNAHSDIERNVALSALMMDMERHFNIPLISYRSRDRDNRAVVALYRMIASSRSFEQLRK